MNRVKKGRPDRTGIRTLLFFVAMGTIPFYILGIGLWLFSPKPGAADRPGQVTNTPGESNSDATWTPLNSGGGADGTITAVIATGQATLTALATLDFDFNQPTMFPGFTPLFTPIGGGGQATFVGGTPVFILSPSPIPTRFITVTPSLTPVATNTPPLPPPTAVVPTSAPPPTTPPLIPPTDTPSF